MDLLIARDRKSLFKIEEARKPVPARCRRVGLASRPRSSQRGSQRGVLPREIGRDELRDRGRRER